MISARCFLTPEIGILNHPGQPGWRDWVSHYGIDGW